jgi:hypothetical protein
VAFVALEVVAFPLMVAWGHNLWFGIDDWDFLATRSIGNVGDLVRPHFGHWTTLPVVLYRLVWAAAGLRSYTPYLVLAVTAHLAVAALLRAVMRRAGIGPGLATLAAGAFLFFGSGAENVLVAFQITFVAALAFGLGQLLLVDHDGPLDRRDWFALLCGLASILCSGVGLTMVVVVATTVLLRRGWRVALFHAAPLAITYAIWLLAAPEGQSTGIWNAQSPWAVFRFVAIGFENAFARLGQLRGVGVLLGLLVVVGLVLAYVPRGRQALRGPGVVPLAMLVGAIAFLAMTGVFRSGQAGALVHLSASGVARARLSRYVYVVVALAIPAITFAANTITRRWPSVTVAVVGLLVVGIPGNIARFPDYEHKQPAFESRVRQTILAAAQDPLAKQLPRSLPAYPLIPDVTIGWLLDNRRSAHIPAPRGLTAMDRATETMNLVLRPGLQAHPTACRRLAAPTELVMRKADSVTVRTGVVSVIYRPAGGGRSRARRLPESTTFVALAGPLRLLVVAPHRAQRMPVICL